MTRHILYRFMLLLSILLDGAVLSAQGFENDSIAVQLVDTVNSAGEFDVVSPLYKPVYVPPSLKPSRGFGDDISAPFEFAVPSFTPGVADIYSWQTGGFTAFGGSEAFPGLMGVESGGVAFGQSFGKFNLVLDATATKYGYFRGLSTSYGFGGSLTYDINDRLSFTLSGNYQANPYLYQPAMFEVSKSASVRGLFDYKLSDSWGILMGAETYHSLRSGHWEVRPVAMPYYLIGGKVPIGIDVGGIIFEIVRNAIESKSKSNNFSNPTISPPVPSGTRPIPPKNW